MSSDLTKSNVIQAYKAWAPVYDTVFGLFLDAGRKHAVRVINRSGGRLLEVGVGTGLSLPEYSAHVRVTGIDLSPDMLAKAEERVKRGNLTNVEALREMDAARLDFPDASFDTVVAMYVITVVPEPERVMAEMTRVCREGGEVIVINHFAAEDTSVRSRVERAFGPRAKKLGWRWDFPKGRVTSHPGLDLVEEVSLKPFGLFTLLRFRKGAAADARAAA